MIDVLIVDDEKRTRTGLEKNIPWEKHGFRVTEAAANAFEALEVMERSVPDVIILDIKMPEMNGLELLEIINEKYPSVRVVLISGYDDFEYAQKAVSAHAFAYILKPIDEIELLKRMEDARTEIEEERAKIKEDDELKHQFAACLPLVRSGFVNQLLWAGIDSRQEIEDRSRFLEMDLTGPEYRIILVETDELAKGGGGAYPDASLRRYSVSRLAARRLEEYANCYVFDNGDRIGLLVAGRDLDGDDIRGALVGLRARANAEVGLAVTISLGAVVDDVVGLERSLASALKGLEYRIVSGRNTIIDAQSIENEGDQVVELHRYDNSLRRCGEEMQRAIKSSDSEAVGRCIDLIVSETESILRTSTGSMNRLLTRLSLFITGLIVAFDFADLEDIGMDGDLQHLLSGPQTFEELDRLLRRIISKIEGEWRRTRENHNNYLVEKVTRFLNDNIFDGISLRKAADYLGVHPNYLSSVFHKEIGKTFIEYEIDLKMNEAKKYLKNSSLRVYEIADRLRYQDVNHFTKVFKKAVGVSPTEYRDLG